MGTVGFIGLGQMGAAMAAHLVDTPGGLLVHDVRTSSCTPLIEAGATFADDAATLAADADVVSVMVLDDAQVRDVVTGPNGILAGASPGTVVAVHSTISRQTAVDLAALAAPKDVEVVDAPVSGGFVGAHDGTLAVMVGGSDGAVARCTPYFEAWAGLIAHVGPVGTGTAAKLARNLLHFSAFTAAGEAQRLAEAAGVDLGSLARVVRHSDAITGGPGAIMLRQNTAPMAFDDPWYEILDHVRTLGRKDLALALELGGQLGVDLPLGRVAAERFAESLGFRNEKEAG